MSHPEDNVEGTGAVFSGNFSIEHGDAFIGNQFRAGGNIYFGSYDPTPRSEASKDDYGESTEIVSLGLCLNPAPAIDSDDFIGRSVELEQMKQVLRPDETAIEQRRMVLGGMGGIGKTQLAVAYARRYHTSYTSVFWLNATTELTIQESLQLLAQSLFRAEVFEKLDGKQTILRVHQWLSDVRNTRWLLIFDNYDDPDLLDIESYIPNTAHGSVIITTRLPEQVKGRRLLVEPIQELDESLRILQIRSQRDSVEHDNGARRLAERLAGLPLALATAGAYLRKTTITFEQYLLAYEQRFNVNPRRPIQLQEYQDRTLYTTWNLSYRRLEGDDPEAAQMLKLLAYLDNQDIWFELLHAGFRSESPGWLKEVASDQIYFENVMGTLAEYCLVKAHSVEKSYSIHSCVHDWALAELNKAVNPQMYWYVFDCLTASIDQRDWARFSQLQYARVTRHAVRLTHHRFGQDSELKGGLQERFNDTHVIAFLLKRQVQLSAAEGMYLLALAGKEKVLGANHMSTLATALDFGKLYLDQGNLDKAEEMFVRALTGGEKELGPNHIKTLEAVNGLGIIYSKHGKQAKAEQMFVRVLAETEKSLGPNHISTLETIHNLGRVYWKQHKLDIAEQMFVRALAGAEKTLGPDHLSTLDTVDNLGGLYSDQHKLAEAEQMYLRSLTGRQKVLGPDHPSILITVTNLGDLYFAQDKLAEAEQMYLRVLGGRERVLGLDHTSTLNAVMNLGFLYASYKPAEAEQMFVRALTGFEKALGSDHQKSVKARGILEKFGRQQGRRE